MHLNLDEHDLRLVHAVQLAPRAPWTTVGPACGLHPITAARRWQRLVDDGLVAMVVNPGPALLRQLAPGFMDLDCRPADRARLIATLQDNPRIASIAIIGSGRSLMLTLMTESPHELAALAIEEIDVLPGVERSQLFPVTNVYGEGSSWRLDALDKHEIRSLDQPLRHPIAPVTMNERHRAVFRALSRDARASASSLAEMVGESASTVTRRIAAMLASGLLSIRCDVTQEAAGWPILVNYFMQVPAHTLDQAGHALARMSENRGTFSIGARSNLLASQWLRQMSDIPSCEARMLAAIPSLHVRERTVSIRTVKRMGRILDADGRSVGVVPLDPWASPRNPEPGRS